MIEKIESSKVFSLIKKYKWWIIGILLLLLFLIIYVLIYLCFKGNGFLYVGIDLEKKDWLSFFGSYLSFAGTILVSIIAIFQSHYFEVKTNRRDDEKRKKEIQPFFSVDITEIDTQLKGVADIFSMSNVSTLPKHKNVTICIENVSEYPIRNVIIFDEYMYQILKPNERKYIQMVYYDSPDAQRCGESQIKISNSVYERTDTWIPKWFTINYDDVDGNELYQVFKFKTFVDKEYYSFDGIYDV